MEDSQRYWSHDVTEEDRHDVGGGVFAGGSAAEIAEAPSSRLHGARDPRMRSNAVR